MDQKTIEGLGWLALIGFGRAAIWDGLTYASKQENAPKNLFGFLKNVAKGAGAGLGFFFGNLFTLCLLLAVPLVGLFLMVKLVKWMWQA